MVPELLDFDNRITRWASLVNPHCFRGGSKVGGGGGRFRPPFGWGDQPPSALHLNGNIPLPVNISCG